MDHASSRRERGGLAKASGPRCKMSMPTIIAIAPTTCMVSILLLTEDCVGESCGNSGGICNELPRIVASCYEETAEQRYCKGQTFA
jgi:hypothetical protein